MPAAPVFVETTRGGAVESVHRGHAVIVGPDGEIQEAWGDPTQVIFPRSSCKMVQALPLVESGAAKAAGLGAQQLALACASHQGAPVHADGVSAWLQRQGLGVVDLECGPQPSRDKALRVQMLRADDPPCRVHNNCSGKHAGFLTLARHLGAHTQGYVQPDHPAQRAVLAAFEECCGETSPGFGIDGCSAPNHRVSLAGLGRAMAGFATAGAGSGARAQAQQQLVAAMIAHPGLVAGEGRACTDLMRAAGGRAAIKTGAEGVFVAILPETGQGVALKIEDGATRASEAAIAALLCRIGVLDPRDPRVAARMDAVQRNFAGIEVGSVLAVSALR